MSWWHSVSVADAMAMLCADTVPITLRCVMGKSFIQGPFKLGFLQPLINVSAVIYMVVSVVSAASLTSSHVCRLPSVYCDAGIAPGPMNIIP